MQDGRFPVERIGGVPVVVAPEEIDITKAPDLRSALLEAAADGPGTLVADMTRTRFCDSSEITRQDDLEQALSGLAADWAGRVEIRLLGPMAPYDFTPTPMASH
jgi:hypothetical protein